MPDIRALRHQILEKRLETLCQDYQSVNNQLATERNPVDKNKMKKQADDIYEEMEKLDRDLRSLELAPLENTHKASKSDVAHIQLELQAKLSAIDFKELEEAIRRILRDYGDNGCAALLLFQKSAKMGGEWCAARIRELLSRETNEGQFRHIPVEFQSRERADAMALLRRLGQDLGVEPADLDEKDFSQRVVQKLCGSLQSGSVVVIECRRCENLYPKPDIFHWILENFWKNLVRQVLLKAQECYEIKIITLLFVDGSLPEGCLATHHCCSLEQFNKNKLLEIPLMAWTQEDIKEWIARYSGLPLHRDDIDRMVDKIYGVTDGDPTLVAHQLLQECCPTAAG